MLNAKSLGTAKDVILNDDLTYSKFTHGVSDSDKFSNYSDSMFIYNKYIGIFCGWIMIRPNVTLEANEKILKLPVIPQYANPFVIGFYGGNTKAFYVDKDGYLISNSQTNSPGSGMQIYLIGSFGINGGGVTQ